MDQDIAATFDPVRIGHRLDEVLPARRERRGRCGKAQPTTVVAHSGECHESRVARSPKIENGSFTQQIIDALSAPEADEDNGGMVSMNELQAYVSLNVTLQTAGLQRPTIDRDNIGHRLAFPLLQ